jgi:hypothetical protein
MFQRSVGAQIQLLVEAPAWPLFERCDTLRVESAPETRYTRGSGVSIAYQAFGQGPPLVMMPAFPSHLDLMWIDPGYAQILRRLASFARVVIFDPRGIGLSDPLDHVPTTEEFADDVAAVMDAAGVERATLFAAGFSTVSMGLGALVALRAGNSRGCRRQDDRRLRRSLGSEPRSIRGCVGAPLGGGPHARAVGPGS